MVATRHGERSGRSAPEPALQKFHHHGHLAASSAPQGCENCRPADTTIVSEKHPCYVTFAIRNLETLQGKRDMLKKSIAAVLIASYSSGPAFARCGRADRVVVSNQGGYTAQYRASCYNDVHGFW